MSQIELGRQELRELVRVDYPELVEKVETIITNRFYRVLSVRDASHRARNPMPTPDQVLALRAAKRADPDGNEGDMGRRCGIPNHGRVSEILHGKPDPDSPTGKKRAVYSRVGVRIKGR